MGKIERYNKHGLPVLGTKPQKKKEKDSKLCKAKGCLYEGEQQQEGFCIQHYFDNVSNYGKTEEIK